MDIQQLFENQKKTTISVNDLRSRGIALNMNDVDSITLTDLRIVEAYQDRKPIGKPDVDEFGNPKVSMKLHFSLKSGEELDISTASDYRDIKLVQQLIENLGKAVEVEDLYILPFTKGALRKDGTEYGQQLFELRFKSIKLKTFEATK
jgi:hypothetical protein